MMTTQDRKPHLSLVTKKPRKSYYKPRPPKASALVGGKIDKSFAEAVAGLLGEEWALTADVPNTPDGGHAIVRGDGLAAVFLSAKASQYHAGAEKNRIKISGQYHGWDWFRHDIDDVEEDVEGWQTRGHYGHDYHHTKSPQFIADYIARRTAPELDGSRRQAAESREKILAADAAADATQEKLTDALEELCPGWMSDPVTGTVGASFDIWDGEPVGKLRVCSGKESVHIDARVTPEQAAKIMVLLRENL